MPVSWSQVQFPGPRLLFLVLVPVSPGTCAPSLVLDLVVLEQVLPQRDLGGKLGRAEVAADGVLGVRVQEPHVVLQARDVGVVLIVMHKAQLLLIIASSTNGVDIVYLDIVDLHKI